jgi:hypothetical protein
MISFHGQPVILLADLLFSTRLLPLPCMGSSYYHVYPVTGMQDMRPSSWIGPYVQTLVLGPM